MKTRVLIVDDEPSVRDSIRQVLERAGYEVTPTADGAEAALHFRAVPPDLVLLDLNLARESGWEVFERLTTQHPSVPIIILTGMPNQYRTARAAGVGALLEKPVEVRVLLETVKAVLAEPAEARLERMCGYQHDTRFVPAQHWGINE
jgi:DNA-binding response OmpR family regulator